MQTTLEELRRNNQGYAFGPNGITEFDLKKVNTIIDCIEKTRTEIAQVLDAVEYTDDYGYYYPNAIIDGDTYRDGSLVVCENGMAYVSIDSDGVLRKSISGGAFPRIDASKLQYLGKKEKTFWTFSTMGAGAHQGLYFEAEVSCFGLNMRNDKYKEFTTKDYDCIIVTDWKDRTSPCGYKYTIDCRGYALCAFKEESELREFLELYGAVEEPYFANDCGQKKYWIYKRELVSVWTREEFDKIENCRYEKCLFNGRKVPTKFVKRGTSLIRYVLRSDEVRY